MHARTSTSFSATLKFDCPVPNPKNFTIQYSGALFSTCTFDSNSTSQPRNEIYVNCENIWNSAGRNWTFLVVPGAANSAIVNATFTVTLNPLPLRNESIGQSNASLTLISINFINCTAIADLSTLTYTCNSTNRTENKNLSSSCTMTCDGFQPGSDVMITLTRASIAYADQPSGSFPEMQISIPAKTSSYPRFTFLLSNNRENMFCSLFLFQSLTRRRILLLLTSWTLQLYQ